MPNSLRKSISSSFNLSGYYLRSEAVDYLVKQFENIDDRDKREAWIEKICDHIGRQNKVQPFLEFEDIKSAVDACCKHVQESSQPLVEVISAFDVPKFDFHIDLKKFFPTRSETHPLLAPPETCTKYYTERFLMLKQRTMRHHLFKSGQQFQVQPIEVLLSSSHKIKHVVILGMLTTMKDGRYQLEDPTGSIPINLTGVKYHTGFFTDNCFVLAEGNYKDEIFHVDSIGFPPTETAEMSRTVFGGGNIFGGLPETSLHNYESLKALENSNPDSMIIFLSEVWLDRKEVMERLNRLFEGYADVPPAVIVLMGNFLSTDMGPKHSLILKSHFKELANMIGNYESLVKSTKFVFVPGPTDSFLGNILPRPPISKTVTEYFLQKVPNSTFTTSPCRLRYCTQEIVLMREDIIIRLCRNSLHAPDISDIPQHFVKTIVSQAYLMPLPVTLSPVYWAHETALRLYPLPDLIVMADSFQPYTAKNTGCIVTNPSSFSNGNYAFKVYIPSSREVEDSQIPEET